MKAKNGQILILTLIIMAIGMIVISPLLSYQASSFRIYTEKEKKVLAYLAADAMMTQIFADIYMGKNIYVLNIEDPERYSPEGEWLNGFDIRTSIDDYMENPPPPLSGDMDWVYLDPEINFGLNTLAYNAIHSFELYLTGNTTVTVNWYFRDSRSGICNYFCTGRMWITDSDHITVQYGNSSSVDTGEISNGTNVAFQQQLTWTVPEGQSGDYFIKFQNLATRRSGGGGCGTINYRSMSDFSAESSPPGRPTFSGIGDEQYTWVRIGTADGDQVYLSQDYTVTITASRRGTDVASIKACLRQWPGPMIRWEEQSIAVLSWIISYY